MREGGREGEEGGEQHLVQPFQSLVCIQNFVTIC